MAASYTKTAGYENRPPSPNKPEKAKARLELHYTGGVTTDAEWLRSGKDILPSRTEYTRTPNSGTSLLSSR